MENKSAKINTLKNITMLLVVIGHCTRIFTINSAIPNMPVVPSMELITKLIYGFHMPLFFFISGFIYSICIKNGKYNNKLNFIKNKFLRLIVPYFVFGILYVAPIMIFLKLTNFNYFEFLFNNILLMKDSRHLWFLPVLFIIFIIINSIRGKDKYKLKLIISIILLLIINILNINIPYISNVINYSLYFIVGIIFNNISWLKNKIINILLGLLLIIMYILIIILNIKIHFVFSSLIVILGLFLIIISINIKNKLLKRISIILNKYNMGVYLFHPMIIYILFSLKVINDFNIYISIIICFLLSYILSIIATKILFKLKLNFIVGEKASGGKKNE